MDLVLDLNVRYMFLYNFFALDSSATFDSEIDLLFFLPFLVEFYCHHGYSRYMFLYYFFTLDSTITFDSDISSLSIDFLV